MEFTSPKPVAVKYGTLYGVVSFAYFVILIVLELNQNAVLGFLSYAIFIAFLILATKEYKGLNEGYMKFKQGVGLGVLTALISSLISAVLTFIYISFIDEAYIDRTLELQRQEMLKNPDMTPEIIDQAMSITESFMSPISVSLITIVSGVISGLIISLIISAIMKNDPPEDDLDLA